MPLPNDLSLLIDDKRVWNRGNAVIFKGGTFQTNGIFDAPLAEEFVHCLVTLFGETQQLEVPARIFVE